MSSFYFSMTRPYPTAILDQLALADSSWQSILLEGLNAVAEADPAYLPTLAPGTYLPNGGRVFAAFSQPLNAVRYVLVGEGPYPRPESATGVCFMDGAVASLWASKGLSKQVNRATSLRNFMKMLLVAEGALSPTFTSGEAMAGSALKALAISSPYIQTLAELQANLTKNGFLLLNASLVFRSDVPPIRDARAWRPFLQVVLAALADHADSESQTSPTLVLWGKAAEVLGALAVTTRFPKAISEHPYNLSFIGNATMQALFGPMRLLRR